MRTLITEVSGSRKSPGPTQAKAITARDSWCASDAWESYEELTGENADLIEVLNLDEAGENTREEVEEPLLSNVRHRIREAGESIRDNDLLRLDTWTRHCDRCDLAALCRNRP